MNFNPDYDQIGNAFTAHYYSKFDVNDPTVRTTGLSDLYDPENSYMTFEGVQSRGRDAILQRFAVRICWHYTVLSLSHNIKISWNNEIIWEKYRTRKWGIFSAALQHT